MTSTQKLVFVLVEGQTEETFVRDVLNGGYFQSVKPDLHLQPVILMTSKLANGTRYKGGILPYSTVKRQIQGSLNASNITLVTTMFDFYGLDDFDFPGWGTKSGDCLAQVEHIENSIDAMRAECPHFGGWIAMLEDL